jgi:hypothetical protein
MNWRAWKPSLLIAVCLLLSSGVVSMPDSRAAPDESMVSTIPDWDYLFEQYPEELADHYLVSPADDTCLPATITFEWEKWHVGGYTTFRYYWLWVDGSREVSLGDENQNSYTLTLDPGYHEWTVTVDYYGYAGQVTRRRYNAIRSLFVGCSVFEQSFKDLGDNVNYDTSISTSDYECGIAGMAARDGDINEDDDGDIIQTYLYKKSDTWWIRADFRTHHDGESWDIDVLCVKKTMPVLRSEFWNLGDNINYKTNIKSSEYSACSIAGMAARDGDIQEHDAGDIIQTYMYQKDDYWWIRADFRTHKDNESWDIDVLCMDDPKGLTWSRAADPPLAIEGVGCEGCNPTQGDTSCSASLPILCIKPEGEPRPNYDVTGNGPYYRGWAGGHMRLTAPVQGTSLTSLSAANANCVSAFGPGYRMAEFHDGKYVNGMDLNAYYGNTWPSSGLKNGGWSFYGYGDISDSTRFWTYVNDQHAHCWDSSSGRGITWAKIADPPMAIEGVGCEGCNPTQGDMSCSASLPILCVNPEGEPRENYAVTGKGPYYRGWTGGHIRLTDPVRGTDLTSLTAANAICASAFGSGYRMAEFHDGKYVNGMDLDAYYGNTWPSSGLGNGGWSFYGYGDISGSTRFWMYVNDQNAHCWD